jgi:hypothetical protein
MTAAGWAKSIAPITDVAVILRLAMAAFRRPWSRNLSLSTPMAGHSIPR